MSLALSGCGSSRPFRSQQCSCLTSTASTTLVTVPVWTDCPTGLNGPLGDRPAERRPDPRDRLAHRPQRGRRPGPRTADRASGPPGVAVIAVDEHCRRHAGFLSDRFVRVIVDLTPVCDRSARPISSTWSRAGPRACSGPDSTPKPTQSATPFRRRHGRLHRVQTAPAAAVPAAVTGMDPSMPRSWSCRSDRRGAGGGRRPGW